MKGDDKVAKVIVRKVRLKGPVESLRGCLKS